MARHLAVHHPEGEEEQDDAQHVPKQRAIAVLLGLVLEEVEESQHQQEGEDIAEYPLAEGLRAALGAPRPRCLVEQHHHRHGEGGRIDQRQHQLLLDFPRNVDPAKQQEGQDQNQQTQQPHRRWRFHRRSGLGRGGLREARIAGGSTAPPGDDVNQERHQTRRGDHRHDDEKCDRPAIRLQIGQQGLAVGQKQPQQGQYGHDHRQQCQQARSEQDHLRARHRAGRCFSGRRPPAPGGRLGDEKDQERHEAHNPDGGHHQNE